MPDIDTICPSSPLGLPRYDLPQCWSEAAADIHLARARNDVALWIWDPNRPPVGGSVSHCLAEQDIHHEERDSDRRRLRPSVVGEGGLAVTLVVNHHGLRDSAGHGGHGAPVPRYCGV